MSSKRTQLHARRDVPQLDRFVNTAACQCFAIRADGDRKNKFSVSGLYDEFRFLSLICRIQRQDQARVRREVNTSLYHSSLSAKHSREKSLSILVARHEVQCGMLMRALSRRR